MDDKEFDRKKFVKSMIKRTERQLDSDYPERMKDYLNGEIRKLEKELHELNQHEKVSTSESSILTGYLDSLVSRKVKSVKIILKKSQTSFLT